MRGIGVTVSIGSLGEAVRPLGGQVSCDCLRSQLSTATWYFFLFSRRGHGPGPKNTYQKPRFPPVPSSKNNDSYET